MITRNSHPLRLLSALLGLSVVLVSSAHAADSEFNDADSHWSDNRVIQAANGIDLTQNEQTVATAGVLVRSPSEIEARVAASGLQAHAAYTIWWMIFNKPQNCAVKNTCTPADLTDSTGQPDAAKIKAVGGTVFNGSGFIAASDGTANLTVLLKDGPLPTGNGFAVPQVAGYLWPNNGLNAYIIMLFRNHGPAVAGREAVQISQSEPNCAVCYDQQGIVFGVAPH